MTACGYIAAHIESRGCLLIITVLEPDHPERKDAEQFIHDRFSIEYDANIRHYMPHLVRLTTFKGELIAHAGYRDAACHQLFVENYFDEPIERVVSKKVGKIVPRASIVEVGNLAEARPGGARAAITALTAYLYGAGFEWVVFTGVTKLRNAFLRLGMQAVDIGEADASRLTTAAQREWGRYYSAGPRVMAGDIRKGYWLLRFSREVLQPLWMGALFEGMRQRKKRKAA